MWQSRIDTIYLRTCELRIRLPSSPWSSPTSALSSELCLALSSEKKYNSLSSTELNTEHMLLKIQWMKSSRAPEQDITGLFINAFDIYEVRSDFNDVRCNVKMDTHNKCSLKFNGWDHHRPLNKLSPTCLLMHLTTLWSQVKLQCCKVAKDKQTNRRLQHYYWHQTENPQSGNLIVHLYWHKVNFLKVLPKLA